MTDRPGAACSRPNVVFVGRPLMTAKCLALYPDFARALGTLHTVTLPTLPGGFPQKIPGTGRVPATLSRTQGRMFRDALDSVERLARRERAAVICAEDPYLSGWIGVELKRRLNIPLNVTIHYGSLALDVGAGGPRGRYWRSAADWILGQADTIRTVNARLAARLRRRYPQTPVYFIPLPVDVEAWNARRRPSPRPTLLTIARLWPEKDIPLVLQCLPRLLKKYPDLRYLIAGEGQLRPLLEAAIRKMGLMGSVRLLGHQDQRSLRSLLARCSVFVLPSRSEGWGLATHEALAAGAPVVVANTGCAGVAVLHERTGLVVPRGDVKALGRAIERLLGDPEWAGELGARGRELVRREFSKETLSSQWARCLQETALSRKAGRRRIRKSS